MLFESFSLGEFRTRWNAPVCDLCVARDTTSQLRIQRHVMQLDGLVAPIEVLQQKFPGRGEICLRPITLPDSMNNAATYFGTTHDRRGLSQINRRIVRGLDLRFAEVLDAAAARDARASRSCFQRTYINVVLSQAELRFRHPCNWAVVFEVCIHLAHPEISLVAALQQRVGHIGGEVVSNKVQRNSLVIPQELSATDVETVDGK